MKLCQKLYLFHWCVSKSNSSRNFKKSTVCNINPKQFSDMSRLKSVMLFFLLQFRYVLSSPLQKLIKKVPPPLHKKKMEQLTKILRYSVKCFMPIPRDPNGRSFTPMKSCYVKRFIKIHGPQPSRPP